MKRIHDFHSVPYLVNDNLWAIGYGHTRTVRANSIIDEAQAERLLRDDMAMHARIVARSINVPLNNNQFGAMVMFCCHAGTLKFEESDLIRRLNKGWYEQVPASLRKWSELKRTVEKARRAEEIALWNTPEEMPEYDGYTDKIS